MLKQTKQNKGLFKSVQAVASATSTTLISSAQLVANEVLLTKSKNLVENIGDFDEGKFEALDNYDSVLDSIETQLANPNLSARKKARLESKLAMLELSATTIESIKLEVV